MDTVDDEAPLLSCLEHLQTASIDLRVALFDASRLILTNTDVTCVEIVEVDLSNISEIVDFSHSQQRATALLGENSGVAQEAYLRSEVRVRPSALAASRKQRRQPVALTLQAACS